MLLITDIQNDPLSVRNSLDLLQSTSIQSDAKF